MHIKPIMSGQAVNSDVGPNKLIRIAPVISYVAEYTDAYGKSHTGMIHSIGGKLFLSTEDEKWTKTLRSPSSWLEKQATPRVQKAQKGELKKLLQEVGIEVEDDLSMVTDVSAPDVDTKKSSHGKDKTSK